MTQKRGIELLRDRKHSKSTAFTKEERERLGLKGLLPYAVSTQGLQMKRILANIERKQSNIEKYIFLSALEDRNERVFYRLLIENIEQLLPIMYTPTVGQVCKEFSSIFRKEKGFFITPEDKGDIANILGLGDLGANGMGIPIGKLALYVAGAGIRPEQCLPVMLDVGTNNKELLEDDIYLGYPYPRIKGQEYMELVDEFVQAVQLRYPKAMIQFEDFLTPNAYKILHKYKDEVLCFNDDIQGTAAVALAGVYSSKRITGRDLRDSRIMFLGAGAAATGIADLLVTAMMNEGLSEASAKSQLSFVDLDGLLVEGRDNLMPHNKRYARKDDEMNFMQAIQHIKPHILIGASGARGAFSKEVVELMSEINDRPVLFALSNPTDKSECTAEEAYSYSRGKAIFASGSPFGQVEYEGKTYVTGQSNNAYIFPGIGLGATICGASKIADEFFLEAAKTLASEVKEEDIKKGKLYPGMNHIRSISMEIAISVITKAREMDLATEYIPSDIREVIKDYMYEPEY